MAEPWIVDVDATLTLAGLSKAADFSDAMGPSIARRRMELTPLEQQMLTQGKRQWTPQIFQSPSTPLPNMMGSPGKASLLWGLPAGLLGGAAAAGLGGGPVATGAAAGGTGVLAAMMAYRHRQAENERLLEQMRSLPPGATKQDLAAAEGNAGAIDSAADADELLKHAETDEKKRRAGLVEIDQNAARWYHSPVSGTIGRASAFLPAAAVGQEKFLPWLTNPSMATAQRARLAMESKYPAKSLENVVLRLGGTDTIDDLKRVWQNRRLGVLGKLYGTATTPINNLMATLDRGTSYNPAADSITAYSDVPEVIAHELGHAVDFNRKPSRSNSSAWLRDPSWRTAYMAMRPLEQKLLGFPGPGSLWQEGVASSLATKGLAGVAKDPDKAKREAWRRLAPAFGTYAGTALAGIPALVSRLQGKTKTGPALAWTAAGAAGGALGGRLVAEIRNLLTAKPKVKAKEKEEKPMRKAAGGVVAPTKIDTAAAAIPPAQRAAYEANKARRLGNVQQQNAAMSRIKAPKPPANMASPAQLPNPVRQGAVKPVGAAPRSSAPARAGSAPAILSPSRVGNAPSILSPSRVRHAPASLSPKTGSVPAAQSVPPIGALGPAQLAAQAVRRRGPMPPPGGPPRPPRSVAPIPSIPSRSATPLGGPMPPPGGPPRPPRSVAPVPSIKKGYIINNATTPPFCVGFLRCCAEMGMPEHVVQEMVAKSAAVDPLICAQWELFEKQSAGIDWTKILTGAAGQAGKLFGRVTGKAAPAAAGAGRAAGQAAAAAAGGAGGAGAAGRAAAPAAAGVASSSWLPGANPAAASAASGWGRAAKATGALAAGGAGYAGAEQLMKGMAGSSPLVDIAKNKAMSQIENEMFPRTGVPAIVPSHMGGLGNLASMTGAMGITAPGVARQQQVAGAAMKRFGMPAGAADFVANPANRQLIKDRFGNKTEEQIKGLLGGGGGGGDMLGGIWEWIKNNKAMAAGLGIGVPLALKGLFGGGGNNGGGNWGLPLGLGAVGAGAAANYWPQIQKWLASQAAAGKQPVGAGASPVGDSSSGAAAGYWPQMPNPVSTAPGQPSAQSIYFGSDQPIGQPAVAA